MRIFFIFLLAILIGFSPLAFIYNANAVDDTINKAPTFYSQQGAETFSDLFSLITHDNNQETIYFDAYVGQSELTKSLMLLPTPMMPEVKIDNVEKAAFETMLFSNIFASFDNKDKKNTDQDLFNIFKTYYDIANSIEGAHTIDTANIKIFSPSSSNNVISWAKGNGYVISDDEQSLIMEYINEGWYFTAIELEAKSVIDTAVDLLRPIYSDVNEDNLYDKIVQLFTSSIINNSYDEFSSLLDVLVLFTPIKDHNRMLDISYFNSWKENFKNNKDDAEEFKVFLLKIITDSVGKGVFRLINPIKISFETNELIYPMKFSDSMTNKNIIAVLDENFYMINNTNLLIDKVYIGDINKESIHNWRDSLLNISVVNEDGDWTTLFRKFFSFGEIEKIVNDKDMNLSLFSIKSNLDIPININFEKVKDNSEILVDLNNTDSNTNNEHDNDELIFFLNLDDLSSSYAPTDEDEEEASETTDANEEKLSFSEFIAKKTKLEKGTNSEHNTNEITIPDNEVTISDIEKIQTALESYYNDNGKYPDSITSGQPLKFNNNTYMVEVPTSMSPNYPYKYTRISDTEYTLFYAIGMGINGISSGNHLACEKGIVCSDRERAMILNNENTQESESPKVGGEIDLELSSRLAGKILLQVESLGEAWYVYYETLKRYYLKDGATAYNALREFSLGITNEDLSKIPIGIEERAVGHDSDGDGLDDETEKILGTDPDSMDSDCDGRSDGEEVKNNHNPLGSSEIKIDQNLVNRLKGRILLQVETLGAAWYVNPSDGKRYYMADGDFAYQIMRFLSLGITNDNLYKIEEGKISN